MKEGQEERPHPALGLTAVMRFLALCLVLATLVQVRAGAFWLGGSDGEVRQSTAASVRRMVVPSGRAVGIKLFSDGVLVVGLEEVGTGSDKCSPAKECGLRVGDIITHLDGEEVNTIEEVRSVMAESDGDALQIQALRDGKTLQFTAEGAEDNSGGYKLGAWLRDSMAGIGTVTFYEPASGLFGALGHGINDVDTAMLMPLESGSIMYATVSDVKQGAKGAPGELHGAFKVNEDMGELYANTASGIFGTLDGNGIVTGEDPIEVAFRDEVQIGPATILSNVSEDKVEEYTVEITHVYPASLGETRNLMVKVTDPRLLETTGGIVQGMSGSPILQNGRLVGAVTHVLVEDPATGYGILAENMLKAAEMEQKTSKNIE